MDKNDREKGEEILKMRRLAAKGIEEQSDGKPVDPLTDIGSLDPDDKRPEPEDSVEREEDVAERSLPAAMALRRNG